MSIEPITGPEQILTGAEPKALTITPAAATRIHALLAQRDPRPEALIVSITTKGCSGLSYDLQYLDKLEDMPKFADVVTQHGVTVVIDPKAALYIVGSIMTTAKTP